MLGESNNRGGDKASLFSSTNIKFILSTLRWLDFPTPHIVKKKKGKKRGKN